MVAPVNMTLKNNLLKFELAGISPTNLEESVD